MFRLLLITVLFISCNGLASIPILCRSSGPVDSFKLNSDDTSKTSPLSIASATSALSGSSPIGVLAARKLAPTNIAPIDGEVVGAKLALKAATGSIFSKPNFRPCPRINTNSWAPQTLCPYAKELLRTFYNQGFCYVLFPNWQSKYYTRCLCSDCRTGCKPTNGRRNRCTLERKYYYTNVWAICRSGWGWRVRNVRVQLPDGKCECKSYRNGCFKG